MKLLDPEKGGGTIFQIPFFLCLLYTLSSYYQANKIFILQEEKGPKMQGSDHQLYKVVEGSYFLVIDYFPSEILIL
jgi:hypothetical protein